MRKEPQNFPGVSPHSADVYQVFAARGERRRDAR
jgi:hypothetical protein